MQASATEKLNNNYIRLPQNAVLAQLSFGVQRVIGEIFSFTGKAKGGKVLSCHRTWEKFKERCGVSRATVGRALKIGRDESLVAGNNKQGFICLIDAAGDEFYRLPNWAFTEEYEVRKGEKRKLFNSELKLYALLYTHCTADKNGKHIYEASISDFAKETGLTERTVQRSIWTLIRAGLIYRPEGNKGVNAYKTSRYTLNYRLVLLKEKTANEIRKEAEKAARRAEELEPFPEFAPSAPPTLGKDDEFIQHVEKPKNKRDRQRGKRKYELHIEIPEMETYKVGTSLFGFPEYDFSTASAKELQDIYKLYSPLRSSLGALQWAFIEFIRFELDERARTSPPQEQ